MVTTGRVLVAVAWSAIVAFFAAQDHALRAVLETSSAAWTLFGLLAFLAPVGVFGSWLLALFHWGTRYDGRRKGLWGVALLVTTFVGATGYWLLAAPRRHNPVAERSPGL